MLWHLRCISDKSEAGSFNDEEILYVERAVTAWPQIVAFERQISRTIGKDFEPPTIEWGRFDYAAFREFMSDHGHHRIELLSEIGEKRSLTFTFGMNWKRSPQVLST